MLFRLLLSRIFSQKISNGNTFRITNHNSLFLFNVPFVILTNSTVKCRVAPPGITPPTPKMYNHFIESLQNIYSVEITRFNKNFVKVVVLQKKLPPEH